MQSLDPRKLSALQPVGANHVHPNDEAAPAAQGTVSSQGPDQSPAVPPVSIEGTQATSVSCDTQPKTYEQLLYLSASNAAISTEDLAQAAIVIADRILSGEEWADLFRYLATRAQLNQEFRLDDLDDPILNRLEAIIRLSPEHEASARIIRLQDWKRISGEIVARNDARRLGSEVLDALEPILFLPRALWRGLQLLVNRFSSRE